MTISCYKANEGREGDMLVCVWELEAHCWVSCVKYKGAWWPRLFEVRYFFLSCLHFVFFVFQFFA